MPLLQGEVSLLTLFADIHYYFNAPSSKPLQHRFDRSSYVYLYHDALQRRGRVEIANHAGTPDQDAFQGYFDTSHIEYSYKHPNLFTITVHGRPTPNGRPSLSPQQDLSQWHLPTYDLRNENKYMYKIHTLDIYFWTTEDATLFLDSLKRVLQEHQLVLKDAPAPIHPEHQDTMSPVVQNLEKLAVTKPFQPSGDVSTTQTHSSPMPVTPVPAPAPAPAATPVSPATTPAVDSATPNYTPMAYNPAAPAAPEPIAHREKTPPPPDAETGTGLVAAAITEHGAGPAPQPGGYPQQPYIPGPPSAIGVQRTNTAGSFGTPTPPQPTPPTSLSFAPPPQQPVVDPNAHLYASQPTSPPAQPQPPASQYANYTPAPAPAPPTPAGYAPQQPPQPFSPGYIPQQQQPQQQPTAPGYATQPGMVHQQLYRPTEADMAGDGHSGYAQLAAGQPAKPGPGQPAATGRLEQGFGRVEKGVGRFLKKLDKKM
ncbi:hypothetical protein P152DRAFT_477948 [Eremomyces bilateralis CBS 781.70]|uniref:RNA recognition motif-containing protein n=1 Tax=Eremomyces bilateralis CBS 781.70 TaxID=1392243 RepID=A0A6G1GG22_9PEZI|nr:uncharacterized protein P152DRAFT_477948 [Eremomyces bilateralis CBS 781.70]KAF1816861.1 hypothetical protein P152DRAFT_477948 [Eremomyces bilateralis CBS 781.70]